MNRNVVKVQTERKGFEENKEQGTVGKGGGERDRRNIEFSPEHIMSEMMGWL